MSTFKNLKFSPTFKSVDLRLINMFQEEKKIVEEKVQQEQASENVAVAENKQAAADDNDGWEVPKTKKGKGAKKTENAKGTNKIY